MLVVVSSKALNTAFTLFTRKNMSMLRVSKEIHDWVMGKKRSDETVDEYLQRKKAEDCQKDQDNKELQTSLLLDALSAMQKDIVTKRYFPEPSEDSVRIEAFYKARRQQHAQDMQDSLAKSNRDTEKRLYGEDVL